MRIPPSSAAFAFVLIAIGIWGFAQSQFVAIWAPGIQPAALRAPMIVASSLISIFAGAGLLVRRFAPMAMRLLLGFLGVWLVWCKGTALVHAPTELASWESLGETAVVVSAAWALAQAAPPSSEREGRGLNTLAGFGPFILYGLALIAFGVSHLAYLTLTASLVPKWMPWHVAWVYFTAATYVATGTALVVGRLARTAAALSALQMALFGVLVWLPRIAGGARDLDTFNETAISFALAASGWIVATSLGRSGQRP